MSNVDNKSGFWEVWGIRTRIRARSLMELIELMRPSAGKIEVSHPITIKSPQGEFFHIPPGRAIEVRSCEPGPYQAVF